MPRIVTTSLVAASALMLSGCVAEDEPPAPSLADQLRATGGTTDGHVAQVVVPGSDGTPM